MARRHLAAHGFLNPPASMSAEAFERSNLMHSVNGFLYCNSAVLDVPVDQEDGLSAGALDAESPKSKKEENELVRLCGPQKYIKYTKSTTTKFLYKLKN